MSNWQIESLESALGALTRRPGIVVGPSVTRIPDSMSAIIKYAFKKAGVVSPLTHEPTEVDYRLALDQLMEALPDKAPLVALELKEGLRTLKASLEVPHLAKAGWSICISLTEDVLFETALRNYLDGIPVSRSVTIVDSPSVASPARTTPVYKLLGNLNNSDPSHTVVLSESEFLLRQQSWPALLRSCPDYLKEAPLFFVGTATVVSLVRSVLSILLAMPRPNVTRLLFLKDDPVIKDPTIRRLCDQCNTTLIDSSLTKLCDAIAGLKSNKNASIPITATSSISDPILSCLSAHETLVSIVPSTKPQGLDISQHLHSLIDGLFRPASLDWNPFLLELDLKRSVSAKIKASILLQLDAPHGGPPKSIVIHGDAGVGKTALLKRVAVDMAASGIFTLWCRRTSAGNWIRHFRSLAHELSERIKKEPTKIKKFVLFCDDPWSLKIEASELMACFDHFAGRIVFVFALRNSDFLSGENSSISIGLRPTVEHEIPYELDDAELRDLVMMLQRIRVVKDNAEAERLVRTVPSRTAKDILCSLWYLVPETRTQLAESLRDEYCRLGEIRESIARVAKQAIDTGEVAHRAYEFVTVTSNLDVGLPVEVLVRSLHVQYEEWLDLTVDGRPLWGLLYDDQDPESQTIVYWTRNEIVTNVLLSLVNGGSVGHVGEARILMELVRNCDVGSPVYRDFVLEIMVRNRTRLSKILTYQQGLELFDIARKTLPYADRVLEHHKGIWMSEVGHEHTDAYKQMEFALQAPLYPGAERDAPQEHIHTSMAAAVVKMVKNETQDREKGLELVREHLRLASSPGFFNPHTSHVAANLLFELAQYGGRASTDKTGITSLAEALQEVEKAFQLIGAHGRGHFKYEKTISMLTALQRKILKAVPDIEALKEIAQQQFEENGSQTGFEVVARRLLVEAAESSKGRAYNEVNIYLQNCIEKIESSRRKTSPELLVVRADLIIRWRIQRTGVAVNWNAFRDDLQLIQASARYRDDVIKLFYYALALFQCGDTTGANATFANLRRLQLGSLSPSEIRCYYLGSEGHPQRFQGTLERKHPRYYVVIPELNLTLPTRTPIPEGGPGSTVHAYIGFALNGPLAVFSKPSDTQILLP